MTKSNPPLMWMSQIHIFEQSVLIFIPLIHFNGNPTSVSKPEHLTWKTELTSLPPSRRCRSVLTAAVAYCQKHAPGSPFVLLTAVLPERQTTPRVPSPSPCRTDRTKKKSSVSALFQRSLSPSAFFPLHVRRHHLISWLTTYVCRGRGTVPSPRSSRAPSSLRGRRERGGILEL